MLLLRLLTQYGRYTCPSSAMNSKTPQCVLRPVFLFSTLNSIGYSMCSDAAGRHRWMFCLGDINSLTLLTQPVQGRRRKEDFVCVLCIRLVYERYGISSVVRVKRASSKAEVIEHAEHFAGFAEAVLFNQPAQCELEIQISWPVKPKSLCTVSACLGFSAGHTQLLCQVSDKSRQEYLVSTLGVDRVAAVNTACKN